MEKYCFLCHSDTGNICNYMLEELKHRKDVTFIYESTGSRDQRSKVLRKLLAIAAKYSWMCRKAAVLRRVWQEQTTAVITNEAMLWLRAGDLQLLRRNGVKLVALLIDPYNADYPSAACARALMQRFAFDQVITFDPEDARTQGFTYSNALYSRFPVALQQAEYDLFYIGNLKGRAGICRELLRLLQTHGAAGYVKLLCGDAGQAAQLPPEVVLKQYIPYPEMLQVLQQTRCILDMTQAGQSGVTLRYYEAVVYNKKLLTNNHHIVDLPFYDPRYMKLYTTLEDIDWDWVRSSDMPDYGYDGRFSPVNLLALIN